MNTAKRFFISDGCSKAPAQPVSAAAGNPEKSLFAPFDGEVVSLLDAAPAMRARAGQALLLLRAGGRLHALLAPADGLVVYIPARPGLRVRKGEGLVWIL